MPSMRRATPLPLALLALVVLLLAGCRSGRLGYALDAAGSDTGAPPDPTDIARPSDLAALDAERQDADAPRPDLGNPADQLAPRDVPAPEDAPVPLDAPQPEDAPVALDAPAPADVPVPADVPAPLDLPAPPDVPVDAGDPRPLPACVTPAARPWTIGACDTLEVLTWNLHNFPKDTRTVERVATLIRQIDADLVALQEVSDVAAFEELLTALPTYDAVLSTDQYSGGEYQKTALLYKTDHVRVGATAPLFSSDSYSFPRPPLRVDVDALLPDGGAVQLVVIVVHLKAGIAAEDTARRTEAIRKLDQYIDGYVGAHPGGKVMVVGDFNEEPTSLDVYAPFADGYAILTSPLAAAGGYSYIPYPNLLDNVVITDSLVPDYEGGATSILSLDVQINAYDYESAISDHRPVSATFPLAE